MSKFRVGRTTSVRRQISIAKVGHWAAVAIALCSSVPAFAQSAADKATARQLATQGIQYYQQGKNSDALELLQKAQQLYDAPVHLIYIGRAQAALGKLVEASETYRRLVRTDLPAGAPQAFKDAVSDAHKELQTLEPKIPSLRIDVAPANAAGLQLKLDGEALSAVVVGINRPTNPGKHTVEATATGFEPASASVDLASGTKQTVFLRLRPRPGAAVPPSAAAPSQNAPHQIAGATTDGAAATGSTGPTNANVGQGKPSEEPFDRASQVVIGARGSMALPMGTVHLGGTDAASLALNGGTPTNPNTDAATGDRFGFGGGVDLHVGYRLSLGKRFALTPSMAYEGNWFDKGKYYSLPTGSVVQNYAAETGGGNSSNVLQITPSEHLVLLGAAIEYPIATNVWQPSYFAEIAFVPYDQLRATGTLTTGTSSCSLADKFNGRGLKFGVGIYVPVTRFFRLTGALGYTAISTTSRDYSDSCPRPKVGSDGKPVVDANGKPVLTTGLAYKSDFSGSDQKIHSLFMLGIGGDFLVGP